MPLPPTPYQLPPLPLPYYIPYLFSMAPLYSQRGPYGKDVEPSNWVKELQSESRSSSSGSIAALHSSPTDPLVLLSQYMAWYRKKFPLQEILIDSAVEKLENEAYGLYSLLDLQAADWHQIGIPEGLGKELARNVMKFTR